MESQNRQGDSFIVIKRKAQILSLKLERKVCSSDSWSGCSKFCMDLSRLFALSFSGGKREALIAMLFMILADWSCCVFLHRGSRPLPCSTDAL